MQWKRGRCFHARKKMVVRKLRSWKPVRVVYHGFVLPGQRYTR